MSEWTDELKQQVIDKYKAGNPTPENSIEILEAVAEKAGKTANGVRMILVKAEVYVKKDAAAGTAKKTASTRVSKADAIAALTTVLVENGAKVEEDIIAKMTGKAAQYFETVIKQIAATED